MSYEYPKRFGYFDTSNIILFTKTENEHNKILYKVVIVPEFHFINRVITPKSSLKKCF